jgi:DNA-directed RNA polymerase specialized sigma24 family protein
MAGAESEFDEAAVGRVFRAESGRSVATLIRVFGDIDVAEDAVQEAFAVALRRWPTDGPPPNPGGWITTTARNCAIDHLRRESRGRELLGEVTAYARLPRQPGPTSTMTSALRPARLDEQEGRKRGPLGVLGDDEGVRGRLGDHGQREAMVDEGSEVVRDRPMVVAGTAHAC